MARFVGSIDDETLTGSHNDDKMWGDFGDDFVFGRGGADMISDAYLNKPAPGTVNNDWYFGGRGADVIYTNSGRDHLEGGSGADRFFAYNEGSFFVDGGRGRDVLHVSDKFEIAKRDGDDATLEHGDAVIKVHDVEKIVFHDWAN